ncbi:MAG: hypothetical protein F6K40_18570 [Okeania sp. SIO3I5]|uniref:hypothetical protein n=1 Tax=Okeania sp. SIO3I5 TaxID=2607805 RepID=UPI0013BAF5D1|nr:hypothetical protein [Okeania sp. SIO3I5]NEQ38159.1 hypothetical protein [Okeania sp. SIO3I5]
MVERVWEVWEVGSCRKLVRVGRNYKTYVSSPFLSRTTQKSNQSTPHSPLPTPSSPEISN